MKQEFLQKNFEKDSYKNLMKIRPVGVELFHADEKTDRHDKGYSRFSEFCERA
jgi:hypothetical protein